MLRDILEQTARCAAVVLRRPDFRVASLERRATYWYQRAARHLRHAEAEPGDRRKRRLYRLQAQAWDRAQVLDQRSKTLAERYGLTKKD